MRYFRCSCGSHTFLSETQCSCNSCGRLANIADFQRNYQVMKRTGLSIDSVIKVDSLIDTKYDMNRWSELYKRSQRKMIGYAS